jgi:hypothetical protein
MLAIDPASSGGSQIPIREGAHPSRCQTPIHRKTPIRRPDASRLWRRCVSHTPIRRRGAFSGSAPLIAWRTPLGRRCPQAESLCSDIDSDAVHFALRSYLSVSLRRIHIAGGVVDSRGNGVHSAAPPQGARLPCGTSSHVPGLFRGGATPGGKLMLR